MQDSIKPGIAVLFMARLKPCPSKDRLLTQILLARLWRTESCPTKDFFRKLRSRFARAGLLSRVRQQNRDAIRTA
jgi:hypothetical protein